MRIQLTKCPVCGTSDNFKSLDYMRDHKVWFEKNFLNHEEKLGFKICQTCGFVTYDYFGEEDLKASYSGQRKSVDAVNVITTNRKRVYHCRILKNVNFDCSKDKMLDIGCSTGYLLDELCGKNGNRDNFFGVEYAEGHLAYAKNEYGFRNIFHELKDPKIQSEKFNIISMYHVFEHMQNPDEILDNINELLLDNGFLYISIPDYFGVFQDYSGQVINNFEDYYHLNHVNCFSKNNLRHLLSRKGFRVVIEDDQIYGYTILCVKDKEVNYVSKEDSVKREKLLNTQKEAIRLFNARKYVEAYSLLPNYVDAYIFQCISSSPEMIKNFKAQEEVYNLGIERTNRNKILIKQLAMLYFQWDGTTVTEPDEYTPKIKYSERLFNEYMQLSHSDDVLYFQMLIEGKYKKNYDKAIEIAKKIIEINPQKFTEVYQWIGYYALEKERKATEAERRT